MHRFNAPVMCDMAYCVETRRSSNSTSSGLDIIKLTTCCAVANTVDSVSLDGGAVSPRGLALAYDTLAASRGRAKRGWSGGGMPSSVLARSIDAACSVGGDPRRRFSVAPGESTLFGDRDKLATAGSNQARCDEADGGEISLGLPFDVDACCCGTDERLAVLAAVGLGLLILKLFRPPKLKALPSDCRRKASKSGF